MKLSTSTTLAAAGALSLAAVLGAALPGAAAPADATASAADAVWPVEVKRFDPDAGATQPIHSYACPPSHPWLATSTSGWGLRGIEIDGDGYTTGDVTVDVRPMRDVNKLAIGWEGTETAVKITQPHDDDFTVVAHCTNDRALAYVG
ncbi:hypothetical protein [Agromyces aerolatus]|uniref:hypothetical protein n=1 Tax=Agromyces sp. LY-1074 TaxID=3074080 RepID=UPI00285475D1|nr:MULTISPECIES: hypothetical protein [unclassified Agromyces]MDR5700573.1 hypothetical protein [Agromyces sp. LY-1074]MDR5707094.1 hypothetical protein [Agromyces sp. LY-1358]